jgi:hypothetical protein
MRLTDKYRPRRLSEVVGQAAARVLEKFCRQTSSSPATRRAWSRSASGISSLPATQAPRC